MNKEIREILEEFVQLSEVRNMHGWIFSTAYYNAKKLLEEPKVDFDIPTWLTAEVASQAYIMWENRKLDGVKFLCNISKTMGTKEISESDYFGLKEAREYLDTMEIKRKGDMDNEAAEEKKFDNWANELKVWTDAGNGMYVWANKMKLESNMTKDEWNQVLSIYGEREVAHHEEDGPGKYYYQINDNGFCDEVCQCKGKTCNIGSIKCQECNLNQGHGEDDMGMYWIVCKKIKEATK